jgi:hypothetical protein
MVTKVNPIFDAAQPRGFLEKSISTFEVTTADISGSTGPEGAIDALIKTISERATIVAHDAMGTANGFWLAGEFPEDDYNNDGTPVTFAAFTQAAIQALGTVDAIDLSTATVAAGTVYRADQV